MASSFMKQHEQALLFLRKAAEDEALLDEVFHSSRVSDTTFGFHCQQAAEKLCKALLSERGVHFRRTHDLTELMDQLTDAGEPLPPSLGSIDSLTPYAIFFRYEEEPSMSPLDREAARRLIAELRVWIEARVAGDASDSPPSSSSTPR